MTIVKTLPPSNGVTELSCSQILAGFIEAQQFLAVQVADGCLGTFGQKHLVALSQSAILV